MNSVGGRGSVFIEEKGSREEEQEPITSRPPRGLWEGWDGVGGTPNQSQAETPWGSLGGVGRGGGTPLPLPSLDPWGITGTNKSL